VRIGDESGDASKKASIDVGQRISALCISLTCTLLLAGTASGIIHIFDIPSHQPLRTISTHQDLVITHLSTMMRPPDLVGHVSLQIGISNGSRNVGQGDVMSLRSVVPFDRTRDPRKRETREVGMILPIQDDSSYIDPGEYPDDELFRDQAYFTQQMVPTANGVNVSMQSRVAELEAEVLKLRDQLGKVKSMNDVMWETVVKKVIKEGKEGVPDGVEERKRKRGRT